MDELCLKVTLFIGDMVANRIPSESTEKLLEQTKKRVQKTCDSKQQINPFLHKNCFQNYIE